jgi:CRISPR-associated protein Cas2
MSKRGRPPLPGPVLMDLGERKQFIAQMGLQTRFLPRHYEEGDRDDPELPLATRVDILLAYLAQNPIKNSNDMMFLVMYDISDNKVRLNVAKYLKKKGCVRMQKSVFLCSESRQTFKEMGEVLREINALYGNHDSIVLLPITQDTVSAMKLIGQNADFTMVIKPPNVLII